MTIMPCHQNLNRLIHKALCPDPGRYKQVPLWRKSMAKPCLETLERRRLLSAGDLDPTFGDGGKVTSADLLQGGSAHGLAVQADGTGLSLAGTLYGTNSSIGIPVVSAKSRGGN